MILGYNTNGLAHHRLLDAIDLLSDTGYGSVAITLDAGALDPYQDPGELDRAVARTRNRLRSRGMRSVIETGARYLLNPRQKHHPTLLDPDPALRTVRIDFLKRAIDIAAELESDAVSLWSGRLMHDEDEEIVFHRLSEALEVVLRHAERHKMTLAFEPEPGFFIDSMDRFARLDAMIDHPSFQLTLDLGHVHCTESMGIPECIVGWAPRIRNIHIEDMNRGVHEHLPFGEGTMDFPAVFRALFRVDYTGPIHVELSRHSHAAPEMVRASFNFLSRLINASDKG
jgi:sugar phosphate isomerase/epimerase